MESGAILFVVMEYIDGQDLAALLAERNKLPPDEATAIIRQTALGLREVHARKIIHRDLKPANFMRAKDGRVVLMDFGLAKSTENAPLTQSLVAAGTPVYMSPEHLRNEPLDVRTDIYSLGLIFYELLTGKRPFAAANAASEAIARLHQPPPPLSSSAPDIPAALDAIVRKCLSATREKRFQTADELIRALDGVNSPPKPAFNRRIAVGIAGAALVLALEPYPSGAYLISALPRQYRRLAS